MADNVIHLPTRQELKSVKGFIGAAYPFLERFTMDMYHVKYDFDGDLIPGSGTAPGKFETTVDASGTFTILANQTNGVARLDTVGSSIDDYVGVSLPNLNMQAQLSCVIAARVSVTSVDDCKVEVGFTYITTNAGAINVLATPSFTGTTANNSAVWVFDTNDSENSTGWQGVSARAGVAPTKLEPTSLNDTYPDAGVFQTLVVALRADTNTQHAKYFILDANGYLAYESQWTENAITFDDNLVPWVFVQNRTSTTKTLDVDFIELWQRRTVS